MRTLMTALAVAVVAIGTTGCASKKYVRTSVGEVNDKVDSLGRSVEQTQERIKANEGKIAEVDSKATAAGNAAQQANAAASNAANSASAANNAANAVGTKLAEIEQQLTVSVAEAALADVLDDAENLAEAMAAAPDVPVLSAPQAGGGNASLA
jgi:chromosome segregation ATPase